MRTIKTIRYIEATPGEWIDSLAQEARSLAVPCFLHNDTLYRIADYERVAAVDGATLARVAREER